VITPSEVARLALDLGKATFDNTFGTVATVQEWIEDGARRASRTVPLVPEQVVGVVDETVAFVARTRADFRQTVDRCYHLVSDLLGADAPAPAATAPPRVRRAS
jgi:hypothetical protein